MKSHLIFCNGDKKLGAIFSLITESLVKMKLMFLACFLVGCSVAKISPFIPRDISKHHVDVARADYVKGKMITAEALKAEQTEAKALENIAEEMSQVTDEPNVPGDSAIWNL